MSKRIGLIDIQLTTEPIVLGFIDNYSPDQIICNLSIKNAIEVFRWNESNENSNLEVDADVCEYLKER